MYSSEEKKKKNCREVQDSRNSHKKIKCWCCLEWHLVFSYILNLINKHQRGAVCTQTKCVSLSLESKLKPSHWNIKTNEKQKRTNRTQKNKTASLSPNISISTLNIMPKYISYNAEIHHIVKYKDAGRLKVKGYKNINSKGKQDWLYQYQITYISE